MFQKLLDQHKHHSYNHSHHSHRETHPLDDIFGSDPEPQYHYEWVGPGNGRYKERRPGSGVFDYVQPGNGEYEREVLPPDHTCCYISICVGVVIAAILLIVFIDQMLKEPAFDCQVDLSQWESSWSILKKDYCCANEELGCPQTPGMVVTAPPASANDSEGVVVPLWLDRWMSDLDLGAKFVMTMALALVAGCLGGAFIFYLMVRYANPPPKAKTEVVLIEEAKVMMTKCHKTPGGKVDVTLMWDTEEDLDLILIAPGDGKNLEISAKAQESHFEEEGEATRPKKGPFIPLHHISHPDAKKGDYKIKVRCGEKELHKDANLTIIKSIHGVREVLHHRMLPCCHEKLICEFSTRD
mmetsp:Transcript_13730/g.29952  ORF Transcript_13730/g.29952 Transcript_13730/m.29952 type:complete len:354 (-) Transcript_13730:86-1147(-)|eukprot:CAMPEP_0206438226 /NCGR_PEP_ID=MMETSP0324_2-20121206/11500_1 /ASSEMBLY_ACC=CAM_ASM_000836 /TAXON_ID=2866 /ORGANISM="Crypthecodinium cohnii, Strain Seligo" /LENGTH=353 /DNA_ID=CAMNT_0053905637 /DNA_START=326 /DNA_END=1387 /DNA_ORIENTATION=-